MSATNQAVRAKRKNYSVYVVELDKRVFQDNWKFRKANPQYNATLECLYVGMTSHTPMQRFMKHKSGYRTKKGHKISSYYVERYGKFLRSSLYNQYNPLTKDQAYKMEDSLGQLLRKKGYAVWWN